MMVRVRNWDADIKPMIEILSSFSLQLDNFVCFINVKFN
jgi:hypothetical protein